MRQLEGVWKKIAKVIAVAFCLFHLYTGVFGLLPSVQQRAVCVAFGLTLVFLFHPIRKSRVSKSSIPPWDLLFIIITLMFCGYAFCNFLKFLPFMVEEPSLFELTMAVAGVVLILEAGRRTIGNPFTILTLIMLLYALFGEFIPGLFGHPPLSMRLLLESVYLSANGIWGFLTGLVATYIALFIIFGAFLLRTGVGQTFADLAFSLVGRVQGGPAKVAVASSGFFAMISGSATANVATTGNFTIPMMKRLGYKPEFAGGVEAVASTGGALTPPIMGSAAFVMAELLNIPYFKVVVAAIIPAFLYYLSLLVGVHLQSAVHNLPPVPADEIQPIRSTLTWEKSIPLFLPIGVMLYLLISGYSLTMVASSACVAVLITYVLVSVICNRSLHQIKESLQVIVDCLEEGARALMTLVPLAVCASIVLFLLGFTGLGLKVSSVIMSVGQNNLILSVALTAFLVLLLGCSLPILIAYLLGVVFAAPLLVSWGIPVLAAHMFCLYYSVLGNITPPICAAVFVASTIANSNWLKTAWVALRFSPILYLMPFLFVYNPTFVMIGSPLAIIFNVGTAVVGTIALASGIWGHFLTKCNIPERLSLVASGLFLLVPGWQTDLLGVALVSVILVRQLQQKKKRGTSV